jgi:alanyl-tRNA synthetase (EC 6.1.1.7)
VLQHKNNNYDTDGFKSLIKAVVDLTPKTHGIKEDDASVRVIADHIPFNRLYDCGWGNSVK